VAGVSSHRRNVGLYEHTREEWVWLVEIAGYRLATSAIDISVDGSDVHFASGVVAVNRSRSVDYRAMQAEESVAVELYLPDASLLAAGVGLRKVVVSRIARGDTYEQRVNIATGYTVNPQYSSVDEPIRFGVSPGVDPGKEETAFPVQVMEDLHAAVVLPDKSQGGTPPWVYGSPGFGVVSSPALVVSVSYAVTGATWDRTTLVQISSNKLNSGYDAAVTVGWFRVDEPLGDWLAFSGTANLDSNSVSDGATIEIVENVKTNLDTTGATYYVSYNEDYPTLPIDTAGGGAGLGNLLRYLIGLLSIPIDWQARRPQRASGGPLDQ